MEEWFVKNNLNVYKYQQEVISKIENGISSDEMTILAASPGSGKTIISIYIIEKYIKENPESKVLVLTHGTTVLKQQYLMDIEGLTNVGFTYNEDGIFDYNKQVNIILPHSLYNIDDLPDFDMLVVDEAHHFYYGDMVQKIINNINPKHQLLLTGTPSIFIEKGIDIIPIPMNRVYNEGMIADLIVDVVSSNYNFGINDFNRDLEISDTIEITEEDTFNTLDLVIDSITTKYNYNINDLPKTMISCKRIEQANQVYKYFNNKGIGCLVSVSGEDINSNEILRFKEDNEYKVLIVVNRGILGFNYNDLVNVIDITGSQNINRIYQLLSRVVRISDKSKSKIFIKVAPSNLIEYYKYVMTAALSLTEEYYLLKYNGKNFNDIEIPVIRDTITKKGGKKSKKSNFKPIDFGGDINIFNFFENNNIDGYVTTTIGRVRSEFLKYNIGGYSEYDLIKLKEKYSKKHHLKLNEPKIHSWFSKNNKELLDKYFPTSGYTEEDLIKLKESGVTKRSDVNISVYSWFYRNNKELLNKHFPSTNHKGGYSEEDLIKLKNSGVTKRSDIKKTIRAWFLKNDKELLDKYFPHKYKGGFIEEDLIKIKESGVNKRSKINRKIYMWFWKNDIELLDKYFPKK